MQGHKVPHWKAFRNSKDDSRGQSCGSTLNILQDILKSGNLLQEMGFVDSQFGTTEYVAINFYKTDFWAWSWNSICEIISGVGNGETFQIGASSRQNFSGNSHYVTNNNSRGPLYITKPPQNHQNSSQTRNFNRNGYIPSAYSNNPTRPSSNRVISTQNGLHGELWISMEYRIGSIWTPGFYFSKRVFDLRLSHKKRIKIAF